MHGALPAFVAASRPRPSGPRGSVIVPGPLGIYEEFDIALNTSPRLCNPGPGQCRQSGFSGGGGIIDAIEFRATFQPPHGNPHRVLHDLLYIYSLALDVPPPNLAAPALVGVVNSFTGAPPPPQYSVEWNVSHDAMFFVLYPDKYAFPDFYAPGAYVSRDLQTTLRFFYPPSGGCFAFAYNLAYFSSFLSARLIACDRTPPTAMTLVMAADNTSLDYVQTADASLVLMPPDREYLLAACSARVRNAAPYENFLIQPAAYHLSSNTGALAANDVAAMSGITIHPMMTPWYIVDPSIPTTHHVYCAHSASKIFVLTSGDDGVSWSLASPPTFVGQGSIIGSPIIYRGGNGTSALTSEASGSGPLEAYWYQSGSTDLVPLSFYSRSLVLSVPGEHVILGALAPADAGQYVLFYSLAPENAVPTTPLATRMYAAIFDESSLTLTPFSNHVSPIDAVMPLTAPPTYVAPGVVEFTVADTSYIPIADHLILRDTTNDLAGSEIRVLQITSGTTVQCAFDPRDATSMPWWQMVLVHGTIGLFPRAAIATFISPTVCTYRVLCGTRPSETRTYPAAPHEAYVLFAEPPRGSTCYIDVELDFSSMVMQAVLVREHGPVAFAAGPTQRIGMTGTAYMYLGDVTDFCVGVDPDTLMPVVRTMA